MAKNCPECGQDFMSMEITGQHIALDSRSPAGLKATLTNLTASEAIVECLACGAAWRGYMVGGKVDRVGYVTGGAFYPTEQLLKGDSHGPLP